MSENDIDKEFAAMLEKGSEPVASFLGLRLLELRAGYARVGMTLTAQHMNFYGVAFGGVIMSLADQAFGYAVNSLSYPSVASQFNTYFLSSARIGDELVAEAKVLKSGRRISLAEISVTNQNGKMLAKCSGSTISVDKE